MIHAAVAALSFALPAGFTPPTPAECAEISKAAPQIVCTDPTLAILAKETARLYDLAQNGAAATPRLKKELAPGQASFNKKLADCKDEKICLMEAYTVRIYGLRLHYPDARAKDDDGVSRGPFTAMCAGLEATARVTFVSAVLELAFLNWRDKSALLLGAPLEAGGTRYTGSIGAGAVELLNKGDNIATLAVPGKPTLDCTLAPM